MRKGDRVKLLEDIPYLNVTKHQIGVVISQCKYKLPKGTGSMHPDRGWDVEVQYRHKNSRIIVQGEELKVLPRKASK
jgi:hypothetical protein